MVALNMSGQAPSLRVGNGPHEIVLSTYLDDTGPMKDEQIRLLLRAPSAAA